MVDETKGRHQLCGVWTSFDNKNQYSFYSINCIVNIVVVQQWKHVNAKQIPVEQWER